MSVSPSYRTLVVDQLGRVVPGVRWRPMFGGVGIYSENAFFALIDDDVLYFKVDPSTRADYEARGMGPFRPFGDGGATMQYYQVPDDLTEDGETLRVWAERAIAVARVAKKPGSRRRNR